MPQQSTSTVSELIRFKAHLIDRGLGRDYVQCQCQHARRFLEYTEQRGIDLGSIQSEQVTIYFGIALQRYKKLKPARCIPYGRVMIKRSVRALLRFVQGEWPPGSKPPMLERFRAELVRCRYRQNRIPGCVSAARQFLRYLREQGSTIEEACVVHLNAFLQMKLGEYQKRHDSFPNNPRKWRSKYTGPIHRLLRLVQPQWPPPEPLANDRERFQREVCDGYGQWLTEVKGLSQETLKKNGDAARMFLRWLGDRADRKSLERLAVSDVDSYLEWRMPGLRRATRYGVSQCVRSFLRYLKFAGLIPIDLSTAVTGPMLYEFEEIPRAFTGQQVKKILEVARLDHSPAGLRDYAILMLLATYGLRAGEVTRLRFEDIDWHGERLRVRQSKTGVESWLPLVTPVGEALLEYLQHGRPQTEWREVFLRVHAPIVPFPRGGSINSVINSQLKQAGIETNGRHGCHAFRFARAASLMDAAVPLKSIGDLLGHQSASSTAIYLRLPTDAFRAISLELPF